MEPRWSHVLQCVCTAMWMHHENLEALAPPPLFTSPLPTPTAPPGLPAPIHPLSSPSFALPQRPGPSPPSSQLPFGHYALEQWPSNQPASPHPYGPGPTTPLAGRPLESMRHTLQQSSEPRNAAQQRSDSAAQLPHRQEPTPINPNVRRHHPYPHAPPRSGSGSASHGSGSVTQPYHIAVIPFTVCSDSQQPLPYHNGPNFSAQFDPQRQPTAYALPNLQYEPRQLHELLLRLQRFGLVRAALLNNTGSILRGVQECLLQMLDENGLRVGGANAASLDPDAPLNGVWWCILGSSRPGTLGTVRLKRDSKIVQTNFTDSGIKQHAAKASNPFDHNTRLLFIGNAPLVDFYHGATRLTRLYI
jgi:hypothetical protein